MASVSQSVAREIKALTQDEWQDLAVAAWDARERAHVIGPTKVGAAILTIDGRVHVGCNVEHRFRSHDVHAEINAISTMIVNGEREIRAILVAAERDRFTPCGACMDWVFQFGGPTCFVAYQKARGEEPVVYSAHDLMPYYPF